MPTAASPPTRDRTKALAPTRSRRPSDRHVISYTAWLEHEPTDPAILPLGVSRFAPPVEIFVRVSHGAEAEQLDRFLSAVQSQDDAAWYVRVIHDDDVVASVFPDDPRIVCEPAGPAPRQALSRAIAGGARGAYMVLGVDDELAPSAIRLIRNCFARDHNLAAVYGDEDVIDTGGTRSHPWCKPQVTRVHLLQGDAFGRPVAYRREQVDAIGFPTGSSDAELEYELALRVIAKHATHRIPRFLVHRRSKDPAPRALGTLAARDVLQRHLEEVGTDADVTLRERPDIGLRVDWRTGPLRVSAVVPFRDKPELLRTCLVGLLEKTDIDELEVLLVDTGSTEPATHELLTEVSGDPRVRVLTIDEQPFNYSRVNNIAAHEATGDVVALLNNDIEVLDDPCWLRNLAAWAMQPEIGVVGALLTFPNGTVQHAGVVLGMRGYASHPWSQLARDAWTAFGAPDALRQWLSVTGACMVTRRSLWEKLDGFDERFQLCGSDVEIGLRAHAAGLANVVVPWVHLNHHESASRGSYIPENDFVVSIEAYRPWIEAGDPGFHPSLTLDDETCALRPSADVAAIDPLPSPALMEAAPHD